MRTTGTFQDVYEAAKIYAMDETGEERQHRPMDPVVRREGEKWMLESGLNSAENADFSVPLEVFDSYFYNGYTDTDYTPSDSDVAEFVAAHTSDEPTL